MFCLLSRPIGVSGSVYCPGTLPDICLRGVVCNIDMQVEFEVIMVQREEMVDNFVGLINFFISVAQ